MDQQLDKDNTHNVTVVPDKDAAQVKDNHMDNANASVQIMPVISRKPLVNDEQDSGLRRDPQKDMNMDNALQTTSSQDHYLDKELPKVPVVDTDRNSTISTSIKPLGVLTSTTVKVVVSDLVGDVVVNDKDTTTVTTAPSIPSQPGRESSTVIPVTHNENSPPPPPPHLPISTTQRQHYAHLPISTTQRQHYAQVNSTTVQSILSENTAIQKQTPPQSPTPAPAITPLTPSNITATAAATVTQVEHVITSAAPVVTPAPPAEPEVSSAPPNSSVTLPVITSAPTSQPVTLQKHPPVAILKPQATQPPTLQANTSRPPRIYAANSTLIHSSGPLSDASFRAVMILAPILVISAVLLAILLFLYLKKRKSSKHRPGAQHRYHASPDGSPKEDTVLLRELSSKGNESYTKRKGKVQKHKKGGRSQPEVSDDVIEGEENVYNALIGGFLSCKATHLTENTDAQDTQALIETNNTEETIAPPMSKVPEHSAAAKSVSKDARHLERSHKHLQHDNSEGQGCTTNKDAHHLGRSYKSLQCDDKVEVPEHSATGKSVPHIERSLKRLQHDKSEGKGCSTNKSTTDADALYSNTAIPPASNTYDSVPGLAVYANHNETNTSKKKKEETKKTESTKTAVRKTEDKISGTKCKDVDRVCEALYAKVSKPSRKNPRKIYDSVPEDDMNPNIARTAECNNVLETATTHDYDSVPIESSTNATTSHDYDSVPIESCTNASTSHDYDSVPIESCTNASTSHDYDSVPSDDACHYNRVMPSTSHDINSNPSEALITPARTSDGYDVIAGGKESSLNAASASGTHDYDSVPSEACNLPSHTYDTVAELSEQAMRINRDYDAVAALSEQAMRINRDYDTVVDNIATVDPPPPRSAVGHDYDPVYIPSSDAQGMSQRVDSTGYVRSRRPNMSLSQMYQVLPYFDPAMLRGGVPRRQQMGASATSGVPAAPPPRQPPSSSGPNTRQPMSSVALHTARKEDRANEQSVVCSSTATTVAPPTNQLTSLPPQQHVYECAPHTYERVAPAVPSHQSSPPVPIRKQSAAQLNTPATLRKQSTQQNTPVTLRKQQQKVEKTKSTPASSHIASPNSTNHLASPPLPARTIKPPPPPPDTPFAPLLPPLPPARGAAPLPAMSTCQHMNRAHTTEPAADDDESLDAEIPQQDTSSSCRSSKSSSNMYEPIDF